MANPLIQAGAIPKGQSSWAPIWSNQFFSGLFTNRDPLRDPWTSYLYSRFYSAGRYETIWDGLNTEISPRLTLIRAPGHSVYNSQTFPAIKDFYPYTITGINTPTTIRVVCDTANAVYDCTGPSTKTLIFNKTPGSGQTRFLAVGNTLYMGDGIDNWQYLSSGYVWKNGTLQPTGFPSGAFFIDGNGNIQLSLGYAIPCSNITISGGTLTATVSFTTLPVGSLSPGMTVQMYGMVSSFLNGVTLTINSVSAGASFSATFDSAALNENELLSPYGTGYIVVPSVPGLTNLTDLTEPTWNTTFLGLTSDYQNLWQMQGPALRPWGVPAPTTAPTVKQQINSSVASSWPVTPTYFMPYPFPVVADGTHIYQLTQAGTTDSGAPTFDATIGHTTTDGGCKWLNIGLAARATLTPYAVGNVILVQWQVTSPIGGSVPTIVGYNPYNHQPIYGPPTPTTITVTYNCFFECTVPGTTGNAATAALSWSSSLGTTVTGDGGVTWTNIGMEVTRTGAATSSPSFSSNVQVAGNIGNSQPVSLLNQIVDSNGAVETVNVAGETGTSAPTWSTIAGALTQDSTGRTAPYLTWLNGGNSAAVGGTAAQPFPWIYSYAYVDDITGEVGPAAPVSVAILQSADNYIQVQGDTIASSALGTINIYRSTGIQGATTSLLYLIAQISNTGVAGTWTYNDFSPDEGYPGSTMNPLIQADLIGVNTAPPTGFVPVVFHLNSIWGFVNNVLYFSYGGGVVDMEGGFSAFPPVNNVPYQTNGITAWSTNNGLYVLLTDSIQLLTGTAPPFNPTKVCNIGILSPNCFSLNGQTPFLYTSDGQVINIDPSSGVSVEGLPIADLLSSSPFTPSTAYVTWHVNGTDQRLFVGDGLTGYYNMINSIPGETQGIAWSPKRTITGGCSAIKSVETSAGVYQLLVGPSSNQGPILFRDPTVSQDNGVSYPAWAVLGSNVLAHPGQIAEVGFIHLDAVRTGTVPKVGVLFGEIYKWSGCPQFDFLSKIVHDPPRLPESKTIYSNRYYTVQSKKPAWCRHMQIQISFGNDSALNELLSLTIFGAVHIERAEVPGR